MVLYKRKQVTYVRPPPVPTDLGTEIYIIPQTKEWFFNYEEYLARMDYYRRRKFVCEITGNSCLTYYEAFDSEAKEIRDLETNFPEALREHILKFLQFNRISRLDLLVDKVYLVFKNEYFPGEEVYVKKLVSPSAEKQAAVARNNDGAAPLKPYISSVKQRGVIREKVQYSNPSDTKYLVSTVGDNAQIIATNQQITRDRNHFTKWLVKTYVKLTVTRSHKVGAPWVVKEKYAEKYHIPKDFPEDLKQFESITPSGEILYEGDDRLDFLSPAPETDAPKQKKPRGRAALKKKAALNAANAAGASLVDGAFALEGTKNKEKGDARHRFPVHHLPALIREVLDKNDQATTSSFQPLRKTIIEDLHLSFDLQNCRPEPSALRLPANARALNAQVVEHLEDEIKDLRNGESEESSQVIAQKEAEIKELRKDSLNSVQEALECWTFLNIYHSVLKIDTFTFDDFVCAMGWNDTQLKSFGRCELLDEIWCAVLGLVVSNEPASTKSSDDTKISGLQITLPPDVKLFTKSGSSKNEENDDAMKGSDSEHEPRPLKIEDDVSENESSSPSPHKSRKNGKSPETVAGQKSSIDADDEAEPSEDDADTEGDNESHTHGHNAYSVVNHRGVKWHEKLRKRNFKDGNWLTIVMGVLSLVEYVPEYSDTIQRVYQTLAPSLITPATPSTVLSQFYTCMGIDLRLKVLHILTSLVVNGNSVRNYIDESLDASANLRRNRLDILRDWKAHVETANKLHVEVFNRLMDAVSTTSDTKLWSSFSRKKHRLNTKGYEMTGYVQALADADPSFKELWDAREAALSKIRESKAQKKDVEMQLSQLDCQRVRLLGKDRHFNRYWWFENNGLPNIHYSGDGDEDEEQQEPESDEEVDDKDDFQTETYLMGCLWIQGPTGMDSLSHLKLTKEEVDSMIGAMEDTNSVQTVKLENEDSPDAETTEKQNNDAVNGAQPLKEMDFSHVPGPVVSEAANKGINYRHNSIESHDSSKIIDKYGGLPKDYDVMTLSAVQRKFIEERAVPLFSGKQWRFFDHAEDVDSLIKWLNPWGKRESLLRKEFLRVREGMTASITARRKALWLDKLPKEETELEGQIEAVEARIQKCRSGVVDELEPEESGDDITPRKRPNRRGAGGANKRQKTAAETIKTGTLDELEQLQIELKETMAARLEQNPIARVTEWVNRTARDEFEKPLYEGGDKAKPRARKSKK
ncbi:hypothetical protein METBIDRAFT_30537 [Metschnikowia bicuspidata var. bicuspidata NRRL YB-4993]|uniref:WAC domain-containing protein n=1 Tax=Metschnikowia bicuspidata var. bicuspidata NRRL YB-4993 TaxID=869754 RepID=A0A1A0HJN6_9ASCO|nr:hypothetical protein METBIDRAFT_30537 [Metschnikowia bicuspidata var. bicuspidata NRRL YB-4993]OBA24211.1 hypothetical protein METBIDRAFT_30537 [Metschnikowia bicuspidata var. bicuspidata NRRL YB-4993]